MAAVRQKFALASTGKATQEIPESKACSGKGASWSAPSSRKSGGTRPVKTGKSRK